MAEASSGTESNAVPTQLAILVPTFDPATDNVEIWSSKVALLAATWPSSKLTELSTRLILGCKGTAYQKLQLHQKELLVMNDPKSIQKLVELVGGTWGQIPLEKKFELVERAIFRGQQKADESADSYVSRNDVVWTELIAKNVRLEEIRAYVLLRGSKLANDDKKRVIVESGAESGGALDVKRVTSAIRMLGSGFFQELTGNRRDRTLKTYDHQAFNLEEETEPSDGEHSFWTTVDESLDDNVLEALAAEDDEDALMVLQFEDSIAEMVQADNELSAFFSSYQDARKRLSEKTRFRGFWGVSRKGDGKGFGKKGKFSKGKGKGGLERRIANSYCRICWKKGHWKNECPMKPGSSSGSSTSSTMPSSIPTSFVTVEEVPDELMNLETIDATSLSHCPEVFCFTAQCGWGENKDNKSWNPHHQRRYKPDSRSAKQKLLSRFGHLLHVNPKSRKEPHSECRVQTRVPVSESKHDDEQGHKIETVRVPSEQSSHPKLPHECLFASSGTVGVVDLGASQTVIGSQQGSELLQQLPWQVRQKVKRTSCQLVFRFGNHQTLVSRHALVLPLGEESFRIAVVDGKTPFLLSNTFLKGIQAVIDTHEGTLWSKKLGRFLSIEPSTKNLFLMDINQLWEQTENPSDHPEQSCGDPKNVEECHHTEAKTKEFSESRSKSCGVDVDNSLEEPESDKPVLGVNNLNRDRNEIHEPTKDNTPPGDLQSSSAFRSSVSSPILSSHVKSECASEVDPISSECLGGREPGTFEGNPETDVGRTFRDEDRVREGQVGSSIPRSFRRQSLDRLVCRNIRKQSEGSTPEIRGLCGEATVGRGAEPECPKWIGQNNGQAQDQGQEPSSQGGLRKFLDSSTDCGFRGRGGSDRTHAGSDESTSADRWDPRAVGLCHHGESQSGKSHGSDGDDDARDAQPRQAIEHQAGTVSVNEAESLDNQSNLQEGKDCDFVFHTPSDSQQQSYRKIISDKVRQFQQELKQCVQSVQQRSWSRSRYDLIEIMCSEQSELTSQVQQAGGKAMRFGLSQGDLQQKEGRHKLFMLLAIHHPKHLWFSPECRPWCLWSGFNMMQSEATLEKILKDRLQSLWQISLGIVLLQHQLQNNSHFHMERPSGSRLWQIHGAQIILQKTYRCCFDLCKIGQLKDPTSQKPIRKRLVVQSTSEVFYRELHGKFCNQNHEHRTIEGSINFQGQRIPLSKFTEWYPSKFAKQIARIIFKERIRSGVLTYVGETEEHPTKRRRLSQKLSPAAIEESFPDVNWQTVMEKVNRDTPRVGTKVIENGPIIEMIQKMCPNHVIQHIVVCRGMDRYIGPCQPTPKGKAPLRRFICIRRRTEDIVVDPEWEPWEHLSLAKLRRKCTPARVGLTIFAQARRQDSEDVSMRPPTIDHSPSADVSIRERTAEDEGIPEAKRHCATQVNEKPEPEEFRQTVDLTSQKHGPLFLKLSTEEQSWLIKLHRNMGHPGAQKLVEFCRQLKCPPHILQAIPEIRCSTCAETSRPRIARPSAIHEPFDFGSVVSMDGILWTNKQGEKFHFYHFVDQSTTYQTAIVSPSRTSQDASQALTLGWLHWAGSPDLLIMDAASEFNSEEFGAFLQGQGIKCRTCAADAHWQNARAERHGGILQVMLSKMDQEETISTYEELRSALAKATSTKNQWSRHRGYAPEVLVFGKNIRVPGSVISDHDLSSHTAALGNETEFQKFQKELQRREQARRAFASVDNDQALRRALVHRTRPHRGSYEKGDWVMMWRKRGESQGQWMGPYQVIIQESNQVVWVTRGTSLYRIAPEHLRPLSAIEDLKRDEENPIREQGGQQGVVQFRPLTEGAILPNPEETPSQQAPGNNPQNNQDVGENPEGTPFNQGDQPDQEPEVISVPSEPSVIIQPAVSLDSPSAHQVPVPDSEPDDELFVEEHECFNLSEDSAWCFSVDISVQDIERWRNEEDPAEMAFLVSAAKKQRSEVRMSQLTEKEREMFRKAKDKEVESWLSTDTVAKILRHQIPRENIMRCRWILTWKPVDPSEATAPNQHTPKARLVVLGYEDPLVHEIPRDSPTMTKLIVKDVSSTSGSQQRVGY